MEPLEIILYFACVGILLYIYTLLFSALPLHVPCRVIPKQNFPCYPDEIVLRKMTRELIVDTKEEVICLERMDTSLHDLQPLPYVNQDRYERKTYINCRDYDNKKMRETLPIGGKYGVCDEPPIPEKIDPIDVDDLMHFHGLEIDSVNRFKLCEKCGQFCPSYACLHQEKRRDPCRECVGQCQCEDECPYLDVDPHKIVVETQVPQSGDVKRCKKPNKKSEKLKNRIKKLFTRKNPLIPQKSCDQNITKDMCGIHSEIRSTGFDTMAPECFKTLSDVILDLTPPEPNLNPCQKCKFKCGEICHCIAPSTSIEKNSGSPCRFTCDAGCECVTPKKPRKEPNLKSNPCKQCKIQCGEICHCVDPPETLNPCTQCTSPCDGPCDCEDEPKPSGLAEIKPAGLAEIDSHQQLIQEEFPYAEPYFVSGLEHPESRKSDLVDEPKITFPKKVEFVEDVSEISIPETKGTKSMMFLDDFGSVTGMVSVGTDAMISSIVNELVSKATETETIIATEGSGRSTPYKTVEVETDPAKGIPKKVIIKTEENEEKSKKSVPENIVNTIPVEIDPLKDPEGSKKSIGIETENTAKPPAVHFEPEKNNLGQPDPVEDVENIDQSEKSRISETIVVNEETQLDKPIEKTVIKSSVNDNFPTEPSVRDSPVPSDSPPNASKRKLPENTNQESLKKSSSLTVTATNQESHETVNKKTKTPDDPGPSPPPP